MASDCPVERKGHHLIFSPGKKKERLLRREGHPLSTSPEGLLARGFPWEPRKDDSLWCPKVPSKLTWATESGENSWWVEGGRTAKGLCPGVGRP